MNRILDSHMHLDYVFRHQPEAIQWMKDNCYAVVSWSYSEKADSVSKLKDYLKSKAEFVHKQSESGLKCFYLAGIHPRCIPPDLKPEQAGSILAPYMDDPLCRGIGEIGLETCDSREKETFEAQLEFGRQMPELRKIIGIHTPRSNKSVVTKDILNILKDYSDIASSIIVDHCTRETIQDVLDCGFMAGVSLSPSKITSSELKDILSVSEAAAEKIMCNTDSAVELHRDMYSACISDGIREDIKEKIFYNNAACFFGIKQGINSK